jgi:hypothetical protein
LRDRRLRSEDRDRWQGIANYHRRPRPEQHIERAADRAPAIVQDMRVNHRCFDTAVAKQFLHGPNVVAGSEPQLTAATAERCGQPRPGKRMKLLNGPGQG